MKLVTQIKTKLEEWREHPRVAAMIADMDRFVILVSNKEYKGSNPAIASVHSPLRTCSIVILVITVITIVFGMIVPIESAAIARGNFIRIKSLAIGPPRMTSLRSARSRPAARAKFTPSTMPLTTPINMRLLAGELFTFVYWTSGPKL